MSTRGLDRWLIPYLASAAKRRHPDPGQSVHLLLCIGDHYEPGNGHVAPAVARSRVEKWVSTYSKTLGGFHDSDGRPPRHSFFYPMEQYVEADLTALAGLCRDGFGEVEIHLHHENDNSADLRKKFLDYKAILAEKHQLLARDRRTGEIAYGFIHGNWALDNSLPDGSHCGVNDELDVLRQTGCYADFTLPSMPSPAQTRKINSIYYAKDDPQRPISHDDGIDVGSGPAPADSLMLIQGPLLLNWGNRKWGLMPRIENGCVQGNQPMTMERVDLWLRARIQIPSRPDWFFVKLHTHGAPEANSPALIGPPAVAFHDGLAARAAGDRNFHYHYVTAREIYNLVVAAEAGWTGSVADALDHRLTWNGAVQPRESALAAQGQANAS
jgi:hypothetical protein